MTAPTTPAVAAEERRNRQDTQRPRAALTPARVLAVFGCVLIVFMIFGPQPENDTSVMFSSYSAGARGSRALYDALARLGFPVRRNDGPIATRPDSGSAYVLLQPSQPLTASERALLLRGVEHGAVLVFTAGDEALADSLHFEVAPVGGYFTLDHTTVPGGNPAARDTDGVAGIMVRAPIPISAIVGSDSASTTPGEAFLWLTPRVRSAEPVTNAPERSTELAAVVRGHRFGNGYAVAIASSDIMMNQAMRDPRPVIAIVHALQTGCSGTRGTAGCSSVVFDEYHHGFGHHADVIAAITHALTDTAPGRMTLELLAAALVLLLAYAVRPIAPRPLATVSRRSPLEHVGALAHAYAQIDSRRLGTRRLVRGLRRRHSLGIPMSVPDNVYLAAMRTRLPAVAPSVDRVAAALSADSHKSPDLFATTGDAIATIERAFPK